VDGLPAHADILSHILTRINSHTRRLVHDEDLFRSPTPRDLNAFCALLTPIASATFSGVKVRARIEHIQFAIRREKSFSGAGVAPRKNSVSTPIGSASLLSSNAPTAESR